MKSLAIISIITLSAIFSSNAQEYNYFHYDLQDGLSGITVYNITQDKDGFLWIGTETGLSRFDGSNFKNFTANEGLDENEIIYLFVDSKNRVWIFPFKNSVYYYYQGKIHNSSNDSLLKKFHLKNEIFRACEDKYGNIFFLELDRVHVLSKSNILKEIDEVYSKSFVTNGCGIKANGNCNLFISFKEDIANHQIRNYEYENEHFVAQEILQDYNFSRNALETNSNYRVIRNGFYFEILNKKTGEYFSQKVPEHFHTVSYIDDSSFLISTFDKAFLYNVYQKKISDSFLVNITVNKCFKDNEGSLWFATMGHGIYRLSSTKFQIYRIGDEINPLPVYSIGSLDSQLFIGSAKNLLLILNPGSKQLKKFDFKTDYIINRITKIHPYNNQSVIFSSNSGLFKIDRQQTSVYLPDIAIKNFVIHNDSLLVATDRSVLEISSNDFSYLDTIWQSRATCAYLINNVYYIGSLNGLYTVNKDKKHSIVNLGDKNSSLKGTISAIIPDKNGALWIATANNGLLCLKNNKVIYYFTTKNGLTSNECRCLYIYNNDLWIGTNKGITKINLANLSDITRFTTREGLDCEIINCICAKGDSIFVGTPVGVTFFYAGKIQNNSVCTLKLTGLQSKQNDWYFKQDSIYLSSHDNFLRFEYTGISFVSGGDMTYYYQLIGLDNTWQSTRQNAVEYQSLPAGDYVFNIYAVNKYGIKSKLFSVPFTKDKVFWELLWVRAVFIITIAFLILIIFRAQIRAVRKKANEKVLRERKMHEVEQMALRSQMNPHFIFNSLNSIQQYIFTGDVVEANRFISNFSSLVRQTLYISQKKFISVDEEVKYLDTYLTIERTKHEGFFNFRVNYEGLAGNILMPPLLLQPFVENSIRHGVLNLERSEGMISVNFLIETDTLRCVIQDNGIGRKKSYALKNNSVFGQHQSKGLELVQKRIESLNSIYKISIVLDIDDIDKQKETGTQIVLKLPLQYDE